MAKFNSRNVQMYDAAPSIALIAKTGNPITASFNAPAYKLDLVEGWWNQPQYPADWQLNIVLQVTGVKRTVGDERYTFSIQGSTEPTFAAPVVLDEFAADTPSIGQYATEFYLNTAVAVLPGLQYIRIVGTFAGTAPSITAYAWIGDDVG